MSATTAPAKSGLLRFRIKLLAAMSLLSLIVGMFLIYNTVSASVTRRRATAPSGSAPGEGGPPATSP